MADKSEGDEKDIAAKMEKMEVKGEEQKTVMGEMKKLVEALYDLRDTYFPANKEDKITTLKDQMKIGLDALQYVPLDELKTTAQRADFELLKGMMLDVLPVYNQQAEEHLVKSAKLNPSSIDAWLALGNCFTKKRELTSAKNCYNRGLEKGPNKRLLCDLSMVERMLAQEDETQNWEQLLADSIKHAKEAVDLEVTDGYSWYNYGNAHLTCFFLTGSRDFEKLSLSSKAYLQAQKDKKMKINPDLYYNYGTVNKYLENYERALFGFETAAVKDPGLRSTVTEEVDTIISTLDLIDGFLKRLVTDKNLSVIASGLEKINLEPPFRKATVMNLSQGLNEKVAVVGKVLVVATPEKAVQLYYILIDSDKNSFVVSLFGARADAIKVGDRLTLFNPVFRVIAFSWKNKIYQFKSIRLQFLEQFHVNEKRLSPEFESLPSFQAQHGP